MQIGVVFPQTEIGADPAGVRAYAQAAQDMGYEHLLVYDHVVGADTRVRPGWKRPYSAESNFHEPFVLFGYLAAIAPKLELVTGVIILPQRQAVLVAKQAAEVDVLTGGRFRLGVGIGWNDVEYEALGMNFKNRARRYEEQIAFMRRLWQEPVLTFEGRYHRITAAGINPLPVQRPIPIWIGGSSEPAIKRACEIADGFFPQPQAPFAGGWPETIEKMHGWLRDAGRDPATFPIEARISVGNRAPDQWSRELEQWRALGATHVSVNTMGGGLAGPDAHVERLREVIQLLR
jgi:probable F420-dependent oxidoreductase